MAHHAVFLLFVALAVYAQSLTGFALALILLGLVGATEVVPLADAVNAVNVMVLVNAVMFLWRRQALHIERALWPALAACLVGGVGGTLLAIWLADSAIQVLRLILVVPTGAVSLGAAGLAAEAIPVVLLVTAIAARQRSPLSPTLLRSVVCVLLVATGAGMMAAAVAVLR